MIVIDAPRLLADHLWLWTGLADGALRRQTTRRHLAELARCPVEQLVLERDGLGRPFIAAPDPTLHFSLARRGGLLTLAAARGRLVGVDLELPLPGPWIDTVAGDFFAADEVRWLDSLSEHDRGDGFFRLWTAKEAVLKALGRGIAQGMAEPDFSEIITLGRAFDASPLTVQAMGQSFHLEWWSPIQDGQTLMICRALSFE